MLLPGSSLPDIATDMRFCQPWSNTKSIIWGQDVLSYSRDSLEQGQYKLCGHEIDVAYLSNIVVKVSVRGALAFWADGCHSAVPIGRRRGGAGRIPFQPQSGQAVRQRSSRGSTPSLRLI